MQKKKCFFFSFPRRKDFGEAKVQKVERKNKRKHNKPLRFDKYFVPLTWRSNVLPLEKTQKSFGFLLVYSYLCTQISHTNT